MTVVVGGGGGLDFAPMHAMNRYTRPNCSNVAITGVSHMSLVFLSLYVMLSIRLSILVCDAASLFCACLVSVKGPTMGSFSTVKTVQYQFVVVSMLNRLLCKHTIL